MEHSKQSSAMTLQEFLHHLGVFEEDKVQSVMLMVKLKNLSASTLADVIAYEIGEEKAVLVMRWFGNQI